MFGSVWGAAQHTVRQPAGQGARMMGCTQCRSMDDCEQHQRCVDRVPRRRSPLDLCMGRRTLIVSLKGINQQQRKLRESAHLSSLHVARELFFHRSPRPGPGRPRRSGPSLSRACTEWRSALSGGCPGAFPKCGFAAGLRGAPEYGGGRRGFRTACRRACRHIKRCPHY